MKHELRDGIAASTMDDGKAKVMSVRMLQALNGALDRAQADQRPCLCIPARPVGTLFGAAAQAWQLRRRARRNVRMAMNHVRMIGAALSGAAKLCLCNVGRAVSGTNGLDIARSGNLQ